MNGLNVFFSFLFQNEPCTLHICNCISAIVFKKIVLIEVKNKTLKVDTSLDSSLPIRVNNRTFKY